MAAILRYCEKSTDMELNMPKLNIVLQGPWRQPPAEIIGIKVVEKDRYLGMWMGKASPMEQYAGPLRRLQNKTAQLAAIPLSL